MKEEEKRGNKEHVKLIKTVLYKVCCMRGHYRTHRFFFSLDEDGMKIKESLI